MLKSVSQFFLYAVFSIVGIYIQFGGIFFGFKDSLTSGFIAVFVPPYSWYKAIEGPYRLFNPTEEDLYYIKMSLIRLCAEEINENSQTDQDEKLEFLSQIRSKSSKLPIKVREDIMYKFELHIEAQGNFTEFVISSHDINTPYDYKTFYLEYNKKVRDKIDDNVFDDYFDNIISHLESISAENLVIAHGLVGEEFSFFESKKQMKAHEYEAYDRLSNRLKEFTSIYEVNAINVVKNALNL